MSCHDIRPEFSRDRPETGRKRKRPAPAERRINFNYNSINCKFMSITGGKKVWEGTDES